MDPGQDATDARANAAQWDAWNGPTASVWVDHADHFDRGVEGYRAPFADAAAIGPDDRVLDVGCGAGQSTRDAAERAHGGRAHGIDLSEPLLDLARRRATAAGLTNTSFAQADAQVHPFPAGEADVVISRNGTMFFADPVAAFANLHRALRPGGRIALQVWQSLERQEFILGPLAALDPTASGPPTDGAPSPVALADPDRIRALLGSAGFTGVEIDGIDRPLDAGADPDDAFTFLAAHQAWVVAEFTPDERARALERLHTDVSAHHVPGRGVLYGSAAWLVRATA